MVAPLYTTDSGLLFHAGKILVITVGLPARGKTHISRALERYLRWMGVKTQVVSLGDYRRKMLGGANHLPKDYFTLGDKSSETIELRKKVSDGCEKLIWDFFATQGQVVIYDANNGTRAARQKLAEKFDKGGIHVVMLESLCDNKEIIEANIRSVKISSPDYRNMNPDLAVQDYYTRIRDHEKYYEPVEETTWPFIRIINVGEKIMVNNIQGYLQSRIVFFLMNIHNHYRTIYFARSGQSLIEHSYKADSDLSPAGWEYAERLKNFVVERRKKASEGKGDKAEERRLVIWTSTRRRAHHTAWPFIADAHPSHPVEGHQPPGEGVSVDELDQEKEKQPRLNVKVIEKPQMAEINPGIWDGLSPAQAQKYYPEDWDRFIKDPYSFRAPRAESYHDLSVRLEPILIELEREQEDLLIIGHASVIRCILAYLIGLPASEIPAIEIARGDLLEVVPTSYGVQSRNFHFWDGPGRKIDPPPNSSTLGRAPSLAKPKSGLSRVVSVKKPNSEETGASQGPTSPTSPLKASHGPAEEEGSPEPAKPEKGDEVHEGADDDDGASTNPEEDDNFYENYAEDTRGKRRGTVDITTIPVQLPASLTGGSPTLLVPTLSPPGASEHVTSPLDSSGLDGASMGAL